MIEIVEMKKNLIIILTLGLVFFSYSCEQDTQNLLTNDISIVSIEYGKSFGECMGYCVKSIKIESVDVNFLASSWTNQSKYPDINITGNIDIEQWNKLVNSIDFFVFKNLDEVIGCPDCADGGAEWIEIETDNIKHKITFEFGNAPTEVEDYINQLRDIMNQYEDQIENPY